MKKLERLSDAELIVLCAKSQLVEEAARAAAEAQLEQDRQAIREIIRDWAKWAYEAGGDEKFTAKYGYDTTDLFTVIEEALGG